MKNVLIAISLFLAAAPLQAQDMVYKFWVELTDKNNNGYSIDHPEAFLSQRSIERRKKQNIPITYDDMPVTASYRDQIAQLGVKVRYTSRWFNAVCIEVKNDTGVMKMIRKLSFVKGSRLMYARKEFDTEKKNPSAMMEFIMGMNAAKKPDNDSEYGFGLNQIQMLKGDELHAQGKRGEGMVIAVLDAGFFRMDEMETFDHLRNEGRLLGTYDFVEGDSLVYEDDMHGMNVLSCMAAYTPGKMVGTAPKASYWLLRTEDAGTENPIEESNWVAGAEFADSVGADLINSSLGYTTFDLESASYTYKNLDGSSLISRAATRCARVGMIVCNAAGNEGSGNWHYIGVPADADSILTVGGVDAMGDHSSFSSFGPSYDGRIKPNIVAQATSTTVASSKGKFYPSQGTSFASPVMCGMVASLWSDHPDVNNMTLIHTIEKSSNQYFHPDNTYGYGLPDFMLAHRMLGGDSSFNYQEDQWLTEIPETYYDEVAVQFYSAKAQSLSIRIRDHKGRKVRHLDFNLSAGEFFMYSLRDLPQGKKGITIEITLNGETKSWSLKPASE